MTSTKHNNHLTTHEAICDAIFRNTQGIDDNDVSLMESAFTQDALQDMTGFRFLNLQFGIIGGRDAIVGMTSETVGRMTTTHMTSNHRTRISEDGKTAYLTCYALAQHWRPGQGRSFAFGSNFLMGNRYEAELIFDGELWKFTRLVIRPQWTQGDFGVFDLDSWSVVDQAVESRSKSV